MSLSLEDLKKTAHLAYLTPDDAEHLLEECRKTLNKIDTLRNIDPGNFSAFLSPALMSQPLREDTPTTRSHLNELAEVATVFIDNCYSVPVIIKA